MNTQEILDKVLDFYHDPNNLGGYEKIDNTTRCKYYISANSKCAIGCLLSDAEFFQKLLDAWHEYRKSEGYSMYSIMDICYSVFDKSFPDYTADMMVEIRNMITAILPEDLPTFESQVNFLSAVQTSHDIAANHKVTKEEFLKDFVTRLKCKLTSGFPQLTLTWKYSYE